MKISVTQDHIDAAHFLSSGMGLMGADDLSGGECCPIALALSCAGFPDVFVRGDGLFRLTPGSELVEVPSVVQAVKRFDRKVLNNDALPVDPFEFELP